MTGNGNPSPPLTLDEFREGARRLAERREAAVASYVEQARVAAEKETAYQAVKATRAVKMKRAGVGITEITERLKGEDDVRAALLDREVESAKVRARLEDLSSIDAQRASLHLLANWSMKYND